MTEPVLQLNDTARVAAIIGRFAKPQLVSRGNSYATVRDFCDSVDQLPQIAPLDGDLKNVQRPWAVKAILAHCPPPARLVEIGGGEPIVSGFLSELGYDVTLVDPYDGSGHGPTAYQSYRARFPHVKILRDLFRPGLPDLAPNSCDAIFSVSVLEHIPPDALGPCFDAMAEFLSPDGFSIHCFDFVLQGNGADYAYAHAQRILAEQARLTGVTSEPSLEDLLNQLRADVETFFLSPQGHHHWRGGQNYSDFPFRKVVSLQMVASRITG